MSIAKVGTSSGPNNDSTSTTVTLPTGYNTSGNLTIVAGVQGITTAYAGNGGAATPPTITVPSGWTALLNAGGAYCIYRFYQGGDPSSISISSTATQWWNACAITYSGVDATNPIDAFSSCFAASGLSSEAPVALIRAPSLNPLCANDQLVCAFITANIGGSTPSTPGGLTNQVHQSGGPSILIADAALTSNALTSNYDTSETSNTSLHVGMQIALRTSGDTPASPSAPIPGFAGMLATISNGNVTSFPLPLGNFYPQTGDEIIVLLNYSGGGTITPPSGYSQCAASGDVCAFAHNFTSGDTLTPTFALGTTGFVAATMLVIRNTGGAISPQFDQAAAVSGTTTIAPGGMTPWASEELLLCYYGEDGTSAGTFGNPSGLKTEFVNAAGPNALFGWTCPAASPTGTFSSSETPSGRAVAGVAVLVSIGSQPASGTASASGTGSSDVVGTGAEIATASASGAGAASGAGIGAEVATASASGAGAASGAGLGNGGMIGPMITIIL